MSRLNNPVSLVKKVLYAGTPSAATRFELSLLSGSDYVFYLNGRFDENVTLWNTRVGGTWEKEDRSAPLLPFAVGVPFFVEVSCLADRFSVNVNGTHFADYAYRYSVLQNIDSIETFNVTNGLMTVLQ